MSHRDQISARGQAIERMSRQNLVNAARYPWIASDEWKERHIGAALQQPSSARSTVQKEDYLTGILSSPSLDVMDGWSADWEEDGVGWITGTKHPRRIAYVHELEMALRLREGSAWQGIRHTGVDRTDHGAEHGSI
jgi:hypothetical protein